MLVSVVIGKSLYSNFTVYESDKTVFLLPLKFVISIRFPLRKNTKKGFRVSDARFYEVHYLKKEQMGKYLFFLVHLLCIHYICPNEAI
jgi:hypothetical protein